MVSEPELGVVAWREPAVTNMAVTEARSGGPWSGGLERASLDQHGRDQRGRWPLRMVDCYGLIPLQDMRLVPHRLYGQRLALFRLPIRVLALIPMLHTRQKNTTQKTSLVSERAHLVYKSHINCPYNR
ncbi:hypothetical protein Hanom_Chr14g01286651 [Helianthus anomalus]